MNKRFDFVNIQKDSNILAKECLYFESESNNEIKLNFFCEIMGLDESSQLIFHHKCRDFRQMNVVDKMLECELVVLAAQGYSKILVWIFLWSLCCVNQCFCPIVFSSRKDIFFFPKLRYEDTFLIKNIIENLLGEDKYSVAFCGKHNICVM